MKPILTSSSCHTTLAKPRYVTAAVLSAVNWQMTAAMSQLTPLPHNLPACVHVPADTKDVAAAMKKQPNKGGIYFPLTAVQVGHGTPPPPLQQLGCKPQRRPSTLQAGQQHMRHMCRAASACCLSRGWKSF